MRCTASSADSAAVATIARAPLRAVPSTGLAVRPRGASAQQRKARPSLAMAESTLQSPDVATTALPVAGAWPLTAPLTRAVFHRLPLVSRLRLRVVCRATRAALSDPALWEVLDASGSHDRYHEHSRALRAASRLAAGGVRELTVPWVLWFRSDSTQLHRCCVTLQYVVDANAKRLRVLRIVGADRPADIEDGFSQATKLSSLKRLLEAATGLEELHADVACDTVEDALAALRNEPPYGPLRVRRLLLRCPFVGRVAEALQAHNSCTQLYLSPSASVFRAQQAGLPFFFFLRTDWHLHHLRVLRIFNSADECGVIDNLLSVSLILSVAPLEELELSGVSKYTDNIAAAAWDTIFPRFKCCTTLRR